MQYNESLYNGDSYNLTEYTSTLVETITPTDADVVKSVGAVCVDSQGTADAIGGSASLQAFLETVTIYQRANTPFAYNNGMYNDFMYNSRADEDEILLMAIKANSDTLVLTDATIVMDFSLALSETFTESDLVTMAIDNVIVEFLFIDENHSIQITNKALNATLRVNDWLSIEQNPQSDNWGD